MSPRNYKSNNIKIFFIAYNLEVRSLTFIYLYCIILYTKIYQIVLTESARYSIIFMKLFFYKIFL